MHSWQPGEDTFFQGGDHALQRCRTRFTSSFRGLKRVLLQHVTLPVVTKDKLMLVLHKDNLPRLAAIALQLSMLVAFVGCTGQGAIPTQTATPRSTNAVPSATATRQLPTGTFLPSISPADTLTTTPTQAIATTGPAAVESSTPGPTPTYDPASWELLPVIPVISANVLKIYKTGQKFHNNPHAFSKVGDCETSSPYFLTEFDHGKNAYNLGPYQDLQTTIDYFAGSFEHTSLASGQGYSASSTLNMLLSDPSQCRPNEIPLLCEFRVNKPSFVFIMFGTNDAVNSRQAFQKYMQMIIDYAIKNGVVPVLATKADNLEGDMSINLIIAQLAHDNNIPLWNFWAAVQDIPHHGLKDDGVHLTYFPEKYNDPAAMQYAFPIRNLTALQVLDELMVAVNQDE